MQQPESAGFAGVCDSRVLQRSLSIRWSVGLASPQCPAHRLPRSQVVMS